jgi:flagellar motility protein MotE (MotC chaperone)
MKYWALTLIFMTLSVLTAGWACQELGIWDDSLLFAADKPEAKATAKSDEKKGRDRELALKEKELADRESIVNDQLKRTDTVIEELKQKLAAKDDVMKKKLAEQEAEFHKKLAAKDAELKRVKRELSSAKDQRAENYKTVYEKMDPKRAAKILDDMDISLSTQIIGDMKQDKAAEILAKMTPEKARQITEHPLHRKISRVNETPSPENSSDAQNSTKGGEQ